jgi:hypothetical protein
MKKNTPITDSNMHELCVGDKLRVVRPCVSEGLLEGKVYTFEGLTNTREMFVSSPKHLSYCVDRFVFEASGNVKRDNRGRFVSPKPQATKRQKPFALKRGALYAVKRKRGFQIAHLRNVGYGDVLVFSRHDKPFVAKRDRVYLAESNEVSEYLKENKKS